ncbi:MAG: 2Fe-2S iron-sulfur cluster binding domain-containing protein [Burkholderiaceae bacterium]|nr:2Fe-2S iron-sulfur cluster binding domain-containing protein [Burkholderiaceae bacterium]
MTIVTILPSGKTIDVEAGTTLLAAMQGAGVAIDAKCDGKGECAGCHIALVGGRKGVSKIGPVENAKLDTIIGIGSKSRLACQASLLGTEDVTIELIAA